MKIIALYLFQLLSVFAGFLYQIILAKNVPVEEYGTLNIIITAIIIFGTIGSFGVGPNILRIYNKFDISGSVNHIFKLLTITTFISITIFSVFIANIMTDFSVYVLIFSICLLVARIFTPVTEAFFQINDKMVSLSLLRFYQQFIRLVAAGLLFFLSLNGEYFLIFAGAFSLVSIWISIVAFKKLSKTVNKFTDSIITNLRTAFSFTTPYAGASIYYQIYFQVNIILFGLLQKNSEAAFYSSVFNFINVSSIFLLLYFQTYMLPKIHRNYSYDYLFSYRKKIIFLSGLSIIPTAIVSYFGQEIFSIAYGDELSNASIYFSILIFFIPIRILINGFGSLLVNEETVHQKSIIQRYAAIISIVLGILLIYVWGIYGAIVSFYIVELFILIKFTILVTKTFKKLGSN